MFLLSVVYVLSPISMTKMNVCAESSFASSFVLFLKILYFPNVPVVPEIPVVP